jgi:hypothetical protein
MNATTTENVHHEAILAHLKAYDENVEICLGFLKDAQRNGWSTEAEWTRRLQDARLMVSSMESLLTYVKEAREG